MSYAVDLDLDGTPEVLVGNTAYRADGTLWWKASVADGLTAVGNFDDDDTPEIVHVESGRVFLLEHTGDVKWGPLTLGYGTLGPPTVADVDGDGRAEIAIADVNGLNVIEPLGFVRWTVPVSHNTAVYYGGSAASAFDFNGDGAYELVYQDDVGLHVYDGRNGSILAEEPLGETCNYG